MKEVMAGGVVAHNSIVVLMLGELFGRKVTVPPEVQQIGAMGAALWAREL